MRELRPWLVLSVFVLTCLSISACGLNISNVPFLTDCKFKYEIVPLSSPIASQGSEILEVRLTGEDVDCKTRVQLDITDFDSSPLEHVQDVSIVAHKTTEISWTLSPKKLGKFDYSVSFPDNQVLGIKHFTVTVIALAPISTSNTNTSPVETFPILITVIVCLVVFVAAVLLMMRLVRKEGKRSKKIKKSSQPAEETCAITLDRKVGEGTDSTVPSRTKVFVAYNHKDAKWLERLRVHFKPLEQRGTIELWDDSKVSPGEKWKEELEAAVQSSTIALLVVSADFLASDFLNEYELPQLLSRAETEGMIIMPLIVAPCLLEGSGIEAFQAINPLSRPLSEMTRSVQEQTLVKLVKAINRRIT